jgi:hypothetical protein
MDTKNPRCQPRVPLVEGVLSTFGQFSRVWAGGQHVGTRLTIRSSRPHVVASATCYALRLHVSAAPPRGGLTQALGPMLRFELALTALLVTACHTDPVRPDLTPYVSLRVSSYDPSTGNFKLTLSNNSSRGVLFLHPLITYSTNREKKMEPRPSFQDPAVLFHDSLLKPGESREISGICRSNDTCDKPNVYAGIDACWSNSQWQCGEYVVLWSEQSVNGP